MPEPNFSNRTLYHGDNLDFLRGMNSETIDLIATDPPFNKSRDFHATPDSLAAGASFQDRWSWRDDIHDEWLIKIQRDNPEAWHVINAAKNVYGDDMGAFICWLGVRLLEMRRVLKPTGSIYLHCDPTASHYLKVLMDAVFGKEQVRNEIVWKRTASHGGSRRWGPIHDTMLFYSKSDDYLWNRVYQEYDSSYIEEFYRFEDAKGRYRLVTLTGAGRRSGDSGKPWFGVNPTDSGRHWAIPMGTLQRAFPHVDLTELTTQEKLDLLNEAGLVYWPARGTIPQQKRYLDESLGVPIQDIIHDVPPISAHAKERLGYPTQKPLALYERIIAASSSPGEVVLDPFCGCATTPVAAERLGRQWVGIDIWDNAYKMVLDRLESEGLAVPYEDDDRYKSHLLTFGSVHYTTTPPVRTDGGEEAVLYLQTPTARAKRYPPPRSQQDKLLMDIGPYCQGCGRYYGFDTRVLEVDHIRPKSDGGSDAYDNLTLLCPPCNREKRDRMTLTGLQDHNRRNGHLTSENEVNIRHGRARAARRRRR